MNRPICATPLPHFASENPHFRPRDHENPCKYPIPALNVRESTKFPRYNGNQGQETPR